MTLVDFLLAYVTVMTCCVLAEKRVRTKACDAFIVPGDTTWEVNKQKRQCGCKECAS